MKVIVADDSMLTRKIVIKYISPLGMEPVEAVNGNEVIEILSREPNGVDLILLDWNMPEMDGMGVLKWIGKEARFSTIPVIMLTSESDELSMNIAMKAGAKAYLSKPFTPEELIDTIKNTLG